MSGLEKCCSFSLRVRVCVCVYDLLHLVSLISMWCNDLPNQSCVSFAVSSQCEEECVSHVALGV